MVNQKFSTEFNALLTSFEIILRSYLKDPDGQCEYQDSFDFEQWMNWLSIHYSLPEVFVIELFTIYTHKVYPNKYVLSKDTQLYYSPSNKIKGRYL